MTKPTKWLCAQRRLRSVWASAQSDQTLRCALNGLLRGPKLSSSGQRRLWSYWGDAQADLSIHWAHSHFFAFIMSRLMYTVCSERKTTSIPFYLSNLQRISAGNQQNMSLIKCQKILTRSVIKTSTLWALRGRLHTSHFITSTSKGFLKENNKNIFSFSIGNTKR